MNRYPLPATTGSWMSMCEVLGDHFDSDRDVCYAWLVDIGQSGDEIRESRIRQDYYLRLFRDDMSGDWTLEQHFEETEMAATGRLLEEGYWS